MVAAAPDEETPFAGPPVDKNYHGKGKIAVLVVLGLVGAARLHDRARRHEHGD